MDERFLYDEEYVKTQKRKSNINKKTILFTSIILAVLIITTITIINHVNPNSFAKEMDKLGDLREVEIYLISYTDENDEYVKETYILEASKLEIRNQVFMMLEKVKYKLYSDMVKVEYIPGQYTIMLVGDVTIHLNSAYITVDHNSLTIKKYKSNTFDEVVSLLISNVSKIE